MPSESVLDLKRHIIDLKKELETKKRTAQNLKLNSKEKSNSIKKVKKEINSGPNHKDEINQRKKENLEDYIRDLKRLKNVLKDYEKRENISMDYDKNFEERHKKLVDLIDSGGINLNDKLTQLLAKSEAIQNKMLSTENEITTKMNEREKIKLHCRDVDRKVTVLSENASIQLHKLLQHLGKLLKQKGNLNSAIRATDSDIIEYNALCTDIEGHQSNNDILKNRNRVIKKKQGMIKYLNQSLTFAKDGYEQILDLLEQKSLNGTEIPNFSFSRGSKIFGADIDDLKDELEKSKNLERYLKEEAIKYNGSKAELEERFSQDGGLENIDAAKNEWKNKANDLTRLLSILMKLNFEIVHKTKEIKILEGKLLLEDYEGLEKLRQNLLKYIAQLEDKLKVLHEQQNRGRNEDLIAEIEQKERIILRLINQLRNLDDKILYVKSNSSPSHCSLPY